MTNDDLKRASAVAGVGTFVLSVLLLLAFAEPGRALLAALLSGVAVGMGVLLAGSLALLTLPIERPAPRVSALVGGPAEAASEEAQSGASLAAALSAGAAAGAAAGVPGAPVEGPGGAQVTSPHDTSTLTVDDVVKAREDLHQTVRLDQGDLQYRMAELTPEEVLKEREGIDEAFLKAGIGLEETPGASENKGEGQTGTGGTT